MKISKLPGESDQDYIKKLEALVRASNYDPDEHIKPGEKADYTDDWMNPPTSLSFVSLAPENKMKFYIDRQKKVCVTGNVGFITQWDVYRSFDSKEARDEEYRKIRKNHPVWRIKKRQANPYIDNLRAYCR